MLCAHIHRAKTEGNPMIPVIKETKSHDTGRKCIAAYYTRYHEDGGAARSSRGAHEHSKRSRFAGSRNQVNSARCIQATSRCLYPGNRPSLRRM
ncbi:hypothetical protein NDU88_003476 [Pleurodeles waltl]|uniref:Uncharacterized protein n=1 Tax=Pleurodeles waltl TaxID=8319 RepID=A0AAV7WP83_PLEWA|nr:hypothetical protein NDU88_003476 [Pleurodeles waltl]